MNRVKGGRRGTLRSVAAATAKDGRHLHVTPQLWPFALDEAGRAKALI